MESLAQVDGYDVFMLATGFQSELLETFRQQSKVSVTGGSHSAYEEMAVPDKQSTAIAIVAHFEYSDRTAQSRQWMSAFEPFDWTVQDAMGADDGERLLEMQRHYGLYCVAPSVLEADGLFLENVVT